MPQPVTAAYARENHDLFRDARRIVANEFAGLDIHDQYYNAFARLLKRDPLGRVAMLGTDQRDHFVPRIRGLLDGTPACRILDVGCGDGQTFALIADAVANGSTIDLIDPNADYVEAYSTRLAAMPHVALGEAHPRAYVPDPDNRLYVPPLDGAYGLILAIHSLYFFEDLAACVSELYARLAPGGSAIIVFADESFSYTGVCYRARQHQLGCPDLAHAHAALCAERLRLLCGSDGAPPAVAGVLAGARLQVFPQASRLYGHSLADVIALSNIAGLSLDADPAKFEVTADVLENEPSAVDLRIEDEPGPRYGTFSVRQPQIVCAITRPD